MKEDRPHHHACLNCCDGHNPAHMKTNGPISDELLLHVLCALPSSEISTTSAYCCARAAVASTSPPSASGVLPSYIEGRQGSISSERAPL